MERKALVDRLKFERGLLQMKDLEQKEFIMAELFSFYMQRVSQCRQKNGGLEEWMIRFHSFF